MVPILHSSLFPPSSPVTPAHFINYQVQAISLHQTLSRFIISNNMSTSSDRERTHLSTVRLAQPVSPTSSLRSIDARTANQLCRHLQKPGVREIEHTLASRLPSQNQNQSQNQKQRASRNPSPVSIGSSTGSSQRRVSQMPGAWAFPSSSSSSEEEVVAGPSKPRIDVSDYTMADSLTDITRPRRPRDSLTRNGSKRSNSAPESDLLYLSETEQKPTTVRRPLRITVAPPPDSDTKPALSPLRSVSPSPSWVPSWEDGPVTPKKGILRVVNKTPERPLRRRGHSPEPSPTRGKGRQMKSAEQMRSVSSASLRVNPPSSSRSSTPTESAVSRPQHPERNSTIKDLRRQSSSQALIQKQISEDQAALRLAKKAEERERKLNLKANKGAEKDTNGGGSSGIFRWRRKRRFTAEEKGKKPERDPAVNDPVANDSASKGLGWSMRNPQKIQPGPSVSYLPWKKTQVQQQTASDTSCVLKAGVEDSPQSSATSPVARVPSLTGTAVGVGINRESTKRVGEGSQRPSVATGATAVSDIEAHRPSVAVTIASTPELRSRRPSGTFPRGFDTDGNWKIGFTPRSGSGPPISSSNRPTCHRVSIGGSTRVGSEGVASTQAMTLLNTDSAQALELQENEREEDLLRSGIGMKEKLLDMDDSTEEKSCVLAGASNAASGAEEGRVIVEEPDGWRGVCARIEEKYNAWNAMKKQRRRAKEMEEGLKKTEVWWNL